jgi:hypothetical protein
MGRQVEQQAGRALLEHRRWASSKVNTIRWRRYNKTKNRRGPSNTWGMRIEEGRRMGEFKEENDRRKSERISRTTDADLL